LFENEKRKEKFNEISDIQRGRNRPQRGDFAIYRIQGAISVTQGAISAGSYILKF